MTNGFKLISEDGLNYLNHSDAMYDVIAIEVGQIFSPPVSPFSTRPISITVLGNDSVPAALLTQLVSIPSLTTDQFLGVIRTFLDAFPQSFTMVQFFRSAPDWCQRWGFQAQPHHLRAVVVE